MNANLRYPLRIMMPAMVNILLHRKSPIKVGLQLTNKCNLDCRFCYFRDDAHQHGQVLSTQEIYTVIDDLKKMNISILALTGGEPLLREDFADVYMALKRKGLLVSVFTTAQILTEDHLRLFRQYPPRDIEITVYGVTRETYERVTRRPGSFDAFRSGLDRLLESGVKVRLKAMALRSNVHELPEIARFCRERTKDFFRFDPLLHLRFDGDSARNEEIRSERLPPEEIVALERADQDRFQSLEKNCGKLIMPELAHTGCDHLFHCGAGNGSFNVSYDGLFRLCSSLWDPECVYDLRKGSLADAWQNFVPKVRDMRSNRKEFLETCRTCPIVNLCLWCPAHAHLETGELDGAVPYFCQVAHARAAAIEESAKHSSIESSAAR